MQRNIIFTFWEPKDKIPAYLELCLETWKKFLPDYEIVTLDYSNLKDWLGENVFPQVLYDRFSLPIQADAIRCAVLKKYGGIWMDVDTIITSSNINKILDFNTDFAIIEPHICFICAKENSFILKKWKKRILKRLEFSQKILNKNYFAKIFFKFFKPRLYKKITKWSFLGNDVLNPILRNSDYLRIERDSVHAMPEFEFAKSFKKPVKIYKNFYFYNDYSDFALKDNGGIILLHNSWTPKEFKLMSKEEFLKTNNTLANILQKILVDDTME